MNRENERLKIMLKENKISDSDFKLLAAALDKKSIFLNIESSMLLNPFQKIAGLNALLIGLIIMIGMSIIGLIPKVYFDGIFGCMLSSNIKTEMRPEFYLLLYQNIVNCLVMTILFLASAIIFRQKRIRIIDFFGTVALSRYPYLILVIFIALLYTFDPTFFHEDTSKGYEMHLSIIGTIASFVWTACFIWQLMTLFFALKEASGLDGKRLWASFLIAIFLGDTISIMLSRAFLYT